MTKDQRIRGLQRLVRDLLDYAAEKVPAAADSSWSREQGYADRAKSRALRERAERLGAAP